MQSVMRSSKARLCCGAALYVFTLALSACGGVPEADFAQTEYAPGTPSASGSGRFARSAAGLHAAEERLRSDPACQSENETFGPAINRALERFNELVKNEADEQGAAFLLPGGHPDMENGVSVRVCADTRMAAYAYMRTVAVHEGLFWILREAAQAAVAYPGDETSLNAALDMIVANALLGRFGEVSHGLAGGVFESLFESAVAFVLYHELGHSSLGHAMKRADAVPGGVEGLSLEVQADFFAVTSMIAAGYSMDGVDLVFSVLERINPDGSPDHPPSSDRVFLAHRVASGDRFAFLLGSAMP